MSFHPYVFMETTVEWCGSSIQGWNMQIYTCIYLCIDILYTYMYVYVLSQLWTYKGFLILSFPRAPQNSFRRLLLYVTISKYRLWFHTSKYMIFHPYMFVAWWLFLNGVDHQLGGTYICISLHTSQSLKEVGVNNSHTPICYEHMVWLKGENSHWKRK